MLEEFWQDVKALGGIPFYLLIMLLFIILGDYKTTLVLGLGVVLSYSLTILIRMLYFKERPQKVKYKTFVQKIDASSFPSLHVMRVVVLGLVLALTISAPLFSMLAVLCILLVAKSRIKQQRHHFSDTVGGMIFGILIALLSMWIGNLIF